MSLMRLPVFTWMTLLTSILLFTAMPVIAVALILLTFDRLYGTNFFNVANGGDPVLWQHLFWLFGHPEVYILILPAMGVVSEVLPTFARKPLFGYAVVVYSGVAIAFLSWGVWAHHMFATGLGVLGTTVFAIGTMLIGAPTGVKIFNWMATLWGGSLRFTTAMLFSVGFVSLFTIGGISGVSHAAVPGDWQQTDTYYIVAHLHYVLFGGTIMGLFSGIYYWWPKFTGRMFNDRIGQINFWLMFIGMNVVFFPMHIVGINGMPRRQFTYDAGMGWEVWNFVMTLGVFAIIIGILFFLWGAFQSLRNGEPAPADPWDGRTLEWVTSSPPVAYNFAQVPHVHSRDPFWVAKYGGEHGGVAIPPNPASMEQRPLEDPHSIHMPWGSYYPLIAALGITLSVAGLLFGFWMSALGVLLIFIGIYGWCLEPVAE